MMMLLKNFCHYCLQRMRAHTHTAWDRETRISFGALQSHFSTKYTSKYLYLLELNEIERGTKIEMNSTYIVIRFQTANYPHKNWK